MIDYKAVILEIDNKANIHYIDRYISLISRLKPSLQSINEKHHILPRSIFPDYSKDHRNIIEIGAKWHYILHWILIKIFTKECYKSKMIFAFNNMKRIIKGNQRKGVLYEISRRYVSECISKNNKGRKMSGKNKMMMSKRTQNTMVVRDENGNYIRVSCDHPKVITGDYVYYRTGYCHKDSTINKIKENSGVRNKTPFYNPVTNKTQYFFIDECPEGFLPGRGDEYLKNRSKCMKGMKFYNNGVVTKRFRDTDDIPDGFVRGRLKSGKFVGFDKINRKGDNDHT